MSLSFDEFRKVSYIKNDDGDYVCVGIDISKDFDQEAFSRQADEFERCKHDPVLIRLWIERYGGTWTESPPPSACEANVDSELLAPALA